MITYYKKIVLSQHRIVIFKKERARTQKRKTENKSTKTSDYDTSALRKVANFQFVMPQHA